MKKIVMLVAVAVMAMGLTGCTKIELGNVGLKISTVGTDRGVSQDSICSGLVFYVPFFQKIIEYPVFNQRVIWTSEKSEGNPVDESISFQTKDSVRCSMNLAVMYSLKKDKVAKFYEDFRMDDIRQFTHGTMRDQVRSAATKIGSEYTFDEVNGAKKEEFLNRLTEILTSQVASVGVVVPKNGVSLVGVIDPPENLKNAINAKVQSIQDAQKSENDLRKTKAEAAKAVAQAEGEAAAMRAKSTTITPQFMELKRLEIDEIRANKWDGKLPVTMLGSGSNTLFNLK